MLCSSTQCLFREAWCLAGSCCFPFHQEQVGTTINNNQRCKIERSENTDLECTSGVFLDSIINRFRHLFVAEIRSGFAIANFTESIVARSGLCSLRLPSAISSAYQLDEIPRWSCSLSQPCSGQCTASRSSRFPG